MRKPVHSRRIVALLAAYAVALQAFLLPLSAMARASFDASLCSGSVTAGDHQSGGGQESPCPCAAGCGMQCSAPPFAGPSAAQVHYIAGTAGILLPPAIAVAILPRGERGPHAARAPPPA